LFMHGWHPESITSVVPGGWSIAVEMTFYAIFPILAMVCRSLPQAITAFIVSLMLYLLFNSIAANIYVPSDPNQPKYLVDMFRYLWFWGQLPVFLIGIVVYFALEYVHRLPRYTPHACVYLSLTAMLFIPLQAQSFPWHITYGLCFGLLTLGLACGATPFLANRLLRLIGKVSFSAYIWHFAVLATFDKLAGLGLNPFKINDEAIGWPYFPAFFVAVFVLTIALSFTTYRLVEQPMIRQGSKLTKRLMRNAVTSPTHSA